MKILRIVSRIFVGMVFIFSGFVKAVDPLGSAYKFSDYFEAFGMGFFSGISIPLSVLLSSTEFIIGVALLLGTRMRFFSWALLLIMSYFTVLTLVLAITNPVTDCGCFGDALVITNWETFFKNVILMVFTVFIFINRNNYREIYTPIKEWVITGVFVSFIFAFSLYCFHHLPALDFRPYHIGSYLPSKMEVPEGAPMDEYETTLVYEKNGVKKEFSVNDKEWQDGTWKWVETKQKLIKKGYEPPIHDFVINNSIGDDITSDILYNPGYTFLLISHKIDLKKAKQYEAMNKIAMHCQQLNGFKFYGITSSLRDEIKKLEQKAAINFEFCSADDIMLKTIVRSNPGLILLKEGAVIAKWHYNDLPDIKDINENYMAGLANNLRKNNENKTVIILLLFFVISIGLGRVLFKK